MVCVGRISYLDSVWIIACRGVWMTKAQLKIFLEWNLRHLKGDYENLSHHYQVLKNTELPLRKVIEYANNAYYDMCPDVDKRIQFLRSQYENLVWILGKKSTCRCRERGVLGQKVHVTSCLKSIPALWADYDRYS